MPAFNNDEIVIPEFIKLGIEPQDAYDYAAIGCIETAVGGKWGYRCTGMSFINFARVMLAALEGGRDATSGKVFLPQEKALSAGNFNNFDEVMDAWDPNPLLHPQINRNRICRRHHAEERARYSLLGAGG